MDEIIYCDEIPYCPQCGEKMQRKKPMFKLKINREKSDDPIKEAYTILSAFKFGDGTYSPISPQINEILFMLLKQAIDERCHV